MGTKIAPLYATLNEHRHEKTNVVVSDTNRAVQSQKMARVLKFQIKEAEVFYFLFSENKGTDQLCSYHTADLCLCFRLCILLVFS